MIRIAICDDSPVFLNKLKSLIEHWENTLHPFTLESFEDGDTLISAHHKHPFDIILLDIIMPLLNGLDCAKEIREKDKNVKIIFLTSSTEYAIDSYGVKASNYLLKPIDINKLYCCLSEVISECSIHSKCINIKALDAVYTIPLSSIEFIESQSKHILFHTIQNKVIRSIEPLYIYEALLHEDEFFKCHRSYIVNIHHINRYTHSEILMHSGERIPISRSNQKIFEDVYFRVMFDKVGDI